MFGGLGKEEYTMLGSGVLDGKITAPFLHKFQIQAVHRMSTVGNRRTCTDQGKYRITWETVKGESCIQSWWITDFVLAVHGRVYPTSSSQLKRKKKKRQRNYIGRNRQVRILMALDGTWGRWCGKIWSEMQLFRHLCVIPYHSIFSIWKL